MQGILKELIGAENARTAKHTAALRERPGAAGAMVQSARKSAYPPLAAKRGRPAKKAAAEKEVVCRLVVFMLLFVLDNSEMERLFSLMNKIKGKFQYWMDHEVLRDCIWWNKSKT